MLGFTISIEDLHIWYSRQYENFSTINGIDTPERRQAFGNKAKQFTCDVVFVIWPDHRPNQISQWGK